MVRTGKAQLIALLPPVDKNTADADDQKIICKEAVRAISKQKSKLDSTLKKGYAMVWDQCYQEVRNKLKGSNNWDRTRGSNLSTILSPR